MMKARRHLISIADVSDQELRDLVRRGLEHSRRMARPSGRLSGSVVGIYFRKTSTRTRTAFSSGALRLGARVIAYGPSDLQENTGESAEDTVRVLARMLDCLVVRTAGCPAEMRTLASQDAMSVVNAMSADEHPTQALADLTTMLQRFGCLEGLRVLYIGEGNNTAAALALALTRFPRTELYLRTPPGYGVPADKLALAVASACAHGSRLEERHGLADVPGDVDVVYTTRWQTTGTEKPDPDWRLAFAPYAVGQRLMERCHSAVFMHDLPAHRGEEVEAQVIDGPASIAFDQAENKLYSAMAVLEWCLGNGTWAAR